MRMCVCVFAMYHEPFVELTASAIQCEQWYHFDFMVSEFIFYTLAHLHTEAGGLFSRIVFWTFIVNLSIQVKGTDNFYK